MNERPKIKSLPSFPFLLCTLQGQIVTKSHNSFKFLWCKFQTLYLFLLKGNSNLCFIFVSWMNCHHICHVFIKPAPAAKDKFPILCPPHLVATGRWVEKIELTKLWHGYENSCNLWCKKDNLEIFCPGFVEICPNLSFFFLVRRILAKQKVQKNVFI